MSKPITTTLARISSTIFIPNIVVRINCWELHVVDPIQTCWSDCHISWAAAYLQSAFDCFVSDFKYIVFDILWCLFSFHSHIDQKLWFLWCKWWFCHIVNMLITKAEFTLYAFKTHLVVIPFPAKVHWTVLSSLKHSPSSAFGSLITVRKERMQAKSFELINAIDFKSILVEFQAIFTRCNVCAITNITVCFAMCAGFVESLQFLYLLRKVSNFCPNAKKSCPIVLADVWWIFVAEDDQHQCCKEESLPINYWNFFYMIFEVKK